MERLPVPLGEALAWLGSSAGVLRGLSQSQNLKDWSGPDYCENRSEPDMPMSVANWRGARFLRVGT